jgi:hypothetical protein
MFAERRTTPNSKSPFGACRTNCVKCAANKGPMPLTRRGGARRSAMRRPTSANQVLRTADPAAPPRDPSLNSEGGEPRARLYAALALCLLSAASVGRGCAVLDQTRERFVEWGPGAGLRAGPDEARAPARTPLPIAAATASRRPTSHALPAKEKPMTTEFRSAGFRRFRRCTSREWGDRSAIGRKKLIEIRAKSSAIAVISHARERRPPFPIIRRCPAADRGAAAAAHDVDRRRRPIVAIWLQLRARRVSMSLVSAFHAARRAKTTPGPVENLQLGVDHCAERQTVADIAWKCAPAGERRSACSLQDISRGEAC